MHTVIASDCTGCDLCIAPCPVDCIEMVAVEPARLWTTADATQARMRYDNRQAGAIFLRAIAAETQGAQKSALARFAYLGFRFAGR